MSITAKTALANILDTFREAAHNKRDMGDLFERLIVNYLKKDPKYDFSDVWLWSEWPDRRGSDTGIDIVAREAATGNYWAIQCKFYQPETRIAKGNIDSFLAESGKQYIIDGKEQGFSNRLIVTTTDLWNKNAEESLANQQIPVERLSIADLEESPIDWSQYQLERPESMVLLDKKKSLRPHQQIALDKVIEGFKEHDRGKLIMACGTGKTYTALNIVEEMVPKGGVVLFLAPSISLVAQSLREWTIDAEEPFHAIAVCSDTKVGRDNEDTRVHDLPFPATTDPAAIVKAATQMRAYDGDKRIIIFSTYQSISQVSRAQKAGLGDFDLIICDEAHRTTGLTRSGDEDSEFVKVHSDQWVRAKKRLYMTATPRIFDAPSKTRASEREAVLYSMDDESRFGPEFYRLGFGQAVRDGLLCDYRVLLVAVDETKMVGVANAYSAHLGDEKTPAAIDSRFLAKIFGAYKGLSKQDVRVVDETGEEAAPSFDLKPMRRAIAFSSSIRGSKLLTDIFPKIVDMFRGESDREDLLACEFDHVDGSMNALIRQNKLSWLKEDSDGKCRVLSNARCLSEGIDVPALDGVIFFDTRDSVVDIVQSVGRVMRKPPAESGSDKEYGYIILPVGIPSDKLTDYDNYINRDPQFQGIWKIIKALRAHDESLVDEAEFRNKIQIIDGGGSDKGTSSSGQDQLAFDFPPLPLGEISEAVYAAIPKKLGDTTYWHDWAKDVARIAKQVKERIHDMLNQAEAKAVFDEFLVSLKNNISPAVDKNQAVELLTQHLITRPVFDALFPSRELERTNPVSKAMHEVLSHMDRYGVEAETKELDEFYESIARRAELAKSEKSRQDLIRSLYDSFFATAFEDVAKNLGIVYTPVEIVDFILQSANDVLVKYFGSTISDDNVHVLDPFTGTGTFITRLLQKEGLISDYDLERKYYHELHANEIVLLAYYVATVNIESAFRARLDQQPDEADFPGIVLTDTFRLREDRDWVDEELLAGNAERIKRQTQAPIRVIVGNPPYSVSQGGAKYARLDARIEETYAKYSQAVNKNSLYDSYIRAIRWASDRIEEQGVVAFVTNGGWLDGNTSAGVRKCFEEEFSAVYVYDLRGNANTSGELRRTEGGSVFSEGTRTPIVVTLLVKDPNHQGPAKIYYHDIGDYLSTQEKLDLIQEAGSYKNLEWEVIKPNAFHDWLNQRSEDFYELKPLHGDDGAIFELRSRGNASSRDVWVYNGNKERLLDNVKRHIDFYEEELGRLAPELNKISTARERNAFVAKEVKTDLKRGKWTDGVRQYLARQYREPFGFENVTFSVYRPFVKQFFYSGRLLNERRYQLPSIFPTPAHENLVIQVTGTGATIPFSCLMSDIIPDLEAISKGQCHPLYYYEKVEENSQNELLGATNDENIQDGYVRREAITDDALRDFQGHYQDHNITKEDIFYYVYGVLHSKEYRKKYAADLKKEWPRIPFAPDFWAFSKAGRKLGELHVNYEQVEPYPLEEHSSELLFETRDYYRVEKMRFGGAARNPDRSVIQVNDHFRLEGIPEQAYEYVVNGKPALEWLIDRYQYTQDPETGIINDPNEWSDDPRYIVDLIKKVVTVSVETVKIVDGLPSLK